MDGDETWGRYWNYLRRQLFVMDTYVSAHNRRVNHCMLLLHPLLSWGFVLPTIAGRLSVLLFEVDPMIFKQFLVAEVLAL